MAVLHLQELLLLNNPCQVDFVKAAADQKTAMAEYRVEVRAHTNDFLTVIVCCPDCKQHLAHRTHQY